MKQIFTSLKGLLLLFLLTSLWSLQSFAQVGSWTKVTNKSPYGSGGLMLLLSDGTVMAKTNAGGGSGNIWVKLTPDSKGSYANGTWTTLASMASDRLYFASQVLKDGRVYVAGGEYGAGGALGEVYNPVNNTWTSAANPSALLGSGQHFSDALSTITPDGKVLQGYLGTDQKTGGWCTGYLIYDPATNSYSSGPSAFGNQNEAAMAKLPDNSVLMVDLGTRNSERYIPSQNKWVKDGNVPVDIFNSGSQGSESGTAFLLPDGRAFFVGGPSNTAYYTPSGNANPGTWSAGPPIPNAQGQTDAPGALMPNGKILLAVNPVATDADHFISPTSFYEFDYLTNAFTRINGPNGTQTEGYAAFVANMLVLPDGNILYCHQGDSQYHVYKPAGSAVAVGKPTISQITCNGNSTYTANGTLFNGISEGSSYGDDWQNASNYPVIRLTNGTNVYYARTYNWNSTGVRTGSAASTVTFTLPAGLPNATYQLSVVANGIASDPISFNPTNCNNNAVATIYQHCNYDASGYGIGLAVGNYTTSQLVALGILDNDVSSVKVQTGYQVVLYDGDNFTGNSLLITADNSCVVNNSFNDIASSIKVSKVSTNIAPTVSLTSPSNGATFTAPATITVSANASDPDGSVSKVEFYSGSTLIGTDNSSPYSISWTGVAAGTYSITAKATDNSSASTTTAAVSITVKAPNTAPTITLTSPSNGATFTSPATVTLSATASDADGTISKVEFYNGSTLITTLTASPYTSMWTGVAAGTYSITAKATDNSGAVTTSSAVTITVQAPGIATIYQHCNFDPTGYGVNLGVGSYTTSQMVALGIKDNDVSSVKVQSGYQVTLYDGDNFTGNSLVITADNSCVVNNSFNDIASSIKVSLVGSNTPPSVSLTSPSNGATYTAPASVTLSANASDADGTISKVEFFNGSTLIATVTSSPYNYSWTGVAVGTYSITAKATDNSNLTTTTPANSITVKAANTAPTITLTSPSNGASFTAPASVTLSANASDADGTISKVEFFNGATLIATVTSSPYNYTWTGVAAGSYSITAKATDNSSATTTTAANSITVKSSGGCSSPQYVENGGYVAGSLVQNVSHQYECKPWPYSGWCNGAAWAYAPGTGMYWTDAWIDKGVCSPSTANQPASAKILTLSPNPANTTVRLDFSLADQATINVQVYDTYGNVRLSINSVSSGTILDISSLPAGFYMIKAVYGQEIINQTLIKN